MLNIIIIGILAFLLLTILSHLLELAAVIVAVGTVGAMAYAAMWKRTKK